MKDLPNNSRNVEASLAIGQLKNADLGSQAQKQSGVANAIAALNMAESMQLLQLQLEESSKANRVALEKSITMLIESNQKVADSNDRHSKAMKWLTIGLIVVGILQVVATFLS